MNWYSLKDHTKPKHVYMYIFEANPRKRLGKCRYKTLRSARHCGKKYFAPLEAVPSLRGGPSASSGATYFFPSRRASLQHHPNRHSNRKMRPDVPLLPLYPGITKQICFICSNCLTANQTRVLTTQANDHAGLEQNTYIAHLF